MDNDPVGRLENGVFLLCLLDFRQRFKVKGFAHPINYNGPQLFGDTFSTAMDTSQRNEGFSNRDKKATGQTGNNLQMNEGDFLSEGTT